MRIKRHLTASQHESPVERYAFYLTVLQSEKTKLIGRKSRRAIIAIVAWGASMASAVLAQTTTVTFPYTGSSASWTVPPWVTSIAIKAWGAQGGFAYCCDGTIGNGGGLGGYAEGTLAVTPGETLTVFVGGQPGPIYSGGSGGFNGGGDFGQFGGGGGGASDVRRGTTGLTDRVIAAGGGGGDQCGCPDHGTGGAGGGLNGSPGIGGSQDQGFFTPGGGGTQTTGGSAGSSPGMPGTFGSGGGPTSYHVAGGGGGWYGGGGAYAAGGGGGSSYVGGVELDSTTSGLNAGSGLVTVTYSLCGNGVVDSGEDCDDGAANGTTKSCCDTTCHFKLAGTACDDGNVCTQTDQCNASGSCIGSNTVVCTAEDACHVPGTCNPSTGICSNPTFDPIGAILADPTNVSTDQQAVQCLLFDVEHGQVPMAP
jgi:Glycine rich protein